MLDIHLATFTATSRKPTLARLISAAGLPAAVAVKSPTGKPYLRAADGTSHGLAIAHLRKTNPSFSAMAVATKTQIGIDIELWPTATDQAFLASIAAPEDAPLIKRITALGQDPATFLWVAKEAALKASGEVMVDPRNISVKLLQNGHFYAATSASATAPVAQTHIRIWRFKVKGSNAATLLALAVVLQAGERAGAAQQWKIHCEDWNLAPVF